MWGHQSDCIGAAVVSLLQRDPRKFDHVAGRLHGRQLPGSLRAYMWADVLLKAERKRMKEVSAEKVVREKFARAVARGLTELRIKKPTQSPINGLIQNAVIETYSKTVSMLPYKHIEHIKESARALNVLYVYDRSYEPYLINWLFPLQIAFRDMDQHSRDHGEHVLELGMYLDLLNTSCFPTWPEVFAIAEVVMQRLQEEDPELHDHLKHIATINVQGSPKEFLVQLIHQEKEKAEALLQSVPNTTRSIEPLHNIQAKQLLADPLIFLRRWVGEGFVSILDTPAVMYVWDQCFMQCWRHTVLQNICLALLELLHYRFMEARNYIEMKEVFLNEACKLYTVDIQMAWIHVENGKHLQDIYNRQQPNIPGSRMSGAQSQATTPAPGLLQTFGIKRLKAKLIVPAETIKREPWLTSINPSGLRLGCSIYFGSIQLNRRISTNTPTVTSAAKDTYGNMVYAVQFPGERYVYPNFDLSQYDVERELGASPYAILSIEYMKPTTSKSSGVNLIPLGWSRLLLFRGGAEGLISVEHFTLLEGETMVALHPGDVPDSLVSTLPATPTESQQDDAYLGYNSELGALVFDPNREPRTPQPQVPPLELGQRAPADTRPQQPPQKTPRQSKLPVSKPPPQTKPPPVSQPATSRSPPPPSVPVPVPRSAPRAPEPNPWVAFDPKIAKNPAPTSCREPFDLYVDSVRYIPDNASIVKVTGRLLKAGDLTDLQDILALPLLSKPARCPEFDFCMMVNTGRQRANPDMVLLLRVYSVDPVTEELVVIGSCLMKVFDTKKKDGALRVGGHQLRLRSGMPDVKSGIANLKSTDLDTAPIIPGCSLLVRVLPHSEDAVPAPSYGSGYYESASSQPTVSEQRIFKSYSEHMVYPQRERDMVIRLQEAEGKHSGGRTDEALLEWLQDRLDIKKHITGSKPAENLSLVRCVRYRLKVGMQMKVNKAFNLPTNDNLFVVCVGQVSPGGQASRMSPSNDGFGKTEPIILTQLKRDGLLTAPQWEGEPETMHPFYDDNSVLVVHLLGIPLTYQPTADNKSAGTLALASGRELKIAKEHVLGWTIVPLFEGNSVQNGTHHVPVFKGDVKADLLQELKSATAKDVLTKRTWNNSNMHMAASLALTLWDAHFNYNELPVVPMYTALEEAAGDAQACQAARDKSSTATGAKVHDLVLNSLPPKFKKQGVKGAVYLKEHGFFDEVVASALPTAVNRAISDGVLVRI